MIPKVYIKICDKGWIIEKMASKLANNLENVDYGLEDRRDACLLYYLPYLTHVNQCAPLEMAFFTHIEADETRRTKFFTVASSVMCCTAQSERYANILREHGHQNVHVVSPGLDFNLFKPKVRVGIVGRTYDSGRKGEHLVKQLINLEGIEWAFSGSGWPLASQALRDDEMPSFYNSVDYVLVPSLIEGGPMCVLEALACGREVIAPSVGWVLEFPHIPFEAGNVDSLRGVLNEIVANRNRLRHGVLSRTWDNWIAMHDTIFRSLLSVTEEPK